MGQLTNHAVTSVEACPPTRNASRKFSASVNVLLTTRVYLSITKNLRVGSGTHSGTSSILHFVVEAVGESSHFVREAVKSDRNSLLLSVSFRLTELD